MKRLLLFLLLASPLFGQNQTTVTGTLVDPNGIAYYPATVIACLSPVTLNPKVAGNSINLNQGANYCIGPVNTTRSGFFQMALYTNASISPAATTWIFTVSAAGTPPPGGNGPLNFSSAGVTISGTSQDVSANINSVGPAQSPSSGGTGTFKNLNNIRFADQFPGATADAKIMAADVDLGATAGEIWINQATGLTITGPIVLSANHILRWIQGGTWTFSGSGKITLNFIGNSVIGPGSGALTFDCSALSGADCIRWQISPFTVIQAGKISGVTIKGGTNANTNLLHMGDVVGAQLDDIVFTNATGTGNACLWFDNVTNWTERTDLLRVHLDNCTKGWRFTNSGGLTSTTSFGYTRALDVRMNVNANQTGMSVESANIYNGTLFVTTNITSATGTVFAISGTQYPAGPNSQMASNLYSFQAECTGCTGATFLNIPAGFLVDGTGTFINTSNTLTNVISGQFNNRLSAFPSGNPILRAFNAAGAELNKYTWQVNNPGGDRILNISDPGGTAAFLFDIGAQTLSSKSLVNPTFLSTIGGNAFNFAVTNPAATRTWSIPDWGANGSATQNQPFVITLTSQYTNSTTTFSNVAGGNTIQFAVAANSNYTATCHLYYQAAATGGLNIEFTGPASPTAVRYGMDLPTAVTGVASGEADAFGTSIGAVSTAGAVNLDAMVSFSLINGANAGTVNLLAKSSAAVQLQIQSGSYCQIQ